MAEVRFELGDRNATLWLSGYNEHNLRWLEAELPVSVHLYGDRLTISGEAEPVRLAEGLFQQLIPLAGRTERLETPQLRSMLAALRQDPGATPAEALDSVVVRTQRGKPVRARTLKQLQYVQGIAEHTLTFGLGPAGTGKTFLAAAMAARAFKDRTVGRIVLTRPAIEAGESLGYLPGNFQDKVDPYFRPLYDAMDEIFERERFLKYQEKGQIEIAPLAYMRGRTLADAFVILDEAQNTTPDQLRMFLTRLGGNAKVVVTGDPTQVDLPRGKRSGLADIERVLGGLPDIAFVRFGEEDVVRSDLVRRIVTAYAADDARQAERREAAEGPRS